MDVNRLAHMGWRARTPLHDGVEQTYRWFLENKGDLRQA
jgi:nucleoside-diphosphate-sugar epimerase